MNLTIKAFFTVLLFLTPAFLSAQEIISDRPDQSESVETVGKNKFQVEAGIDFSSKKYEDIEGYSDTGFVGIIDLKEKNLVLPTILFRYGVLKNLEVRLGLDFDKQILSSNNSLFEGSSDLTLNAPTFGVKYEISKGEGIVPDFSVLGSVKIPKVGDEFKQVEYFVPELVLLFSNEINDRIDIEYNIGLEWSDDLEEKSFFYAVATGFSVTPKLGAFFEFYGDLKSDIKNSSQNIDFGLTYLLKNNLQIDAYGGLGLTDETKDFILGTGFAYKF